MSTVLEERRQAHATLRAKYAEIQEFEQTTVRAARRMLMPA